MCRISLSPFTPTVPSPGLVTHTEDGSIPEPRPWQRERLKNHFPADLSLFGVGLVCGMKSLSRAKSCCDLHPSSSFQAQAVPLQSNINAQRSISFPPFGQ